MRTRSGDATEPMTHASHLRVLNTLSVMRHMLKKIVVVRMEVLAETVTVAFHINVL